MHAYDFKMYAYDFNIPDEVWLLDYSKLDSLRLEIDFGIDNNKKDEYCNGASKRYQGLSVSNNNAKFYEQAERFNDLTYNGHYWVEGIIFSALESLTVVCDKDFDAQHPAGTALDELITVQYYSAETFVKSRYTNMKAGNSIWTWANLGELNLMHINLYEGFNLIFDVGPEQQGVYQFKVTYKNANGLVLETTFPKIKLQGR